MRIRKWRVVRVRSRDKTGYESPHLKFWRLRSAQKACDRLNELSAHERVIGRFDALRGIHTKPLWVPILARELSAIRVHHMLMMSGSLDRHPAGVKPSTRATRAPSGTPLKDRYSSESIDLSWALINPDPVAPGGNVVREERTREDKDFDQVAVGSPTAPLAGGADVLRAGVTEPGADVPWPDVHDEAGGETIREVTGEDHPGPAARSGAGAGGATVPAGAGVDSVRRARRFVDVAHADVDGIPDYEH